MQSIIPGLVFLIIVFLISVFLTYGNKTVIVDRKKLNEFLRFFLAGIFIQTLHFSEELFTEFYKQYPSLLGLDEWPKSFFILFNLSWIIIWLVSCVGIFKRILISYIPVWFLILSSILNGAAHPVFSIIAKGYFPGLITSFVEGVWGVFMLYKLKKLSASK